MNSALLTGISFFISFAALLAYCLVNDDREENKVPRERLRVILIVMSLLSVGLLGYTLMSPNTY
jgi:hypothetical protein